MRISYCGSFVLSCLAFANASLGTNFPGGPVDTTLSVTNSSGSGVGIQSRSTAPNGFGLSASAPGANGTGVRAEGAAYGLSAKGASAGVSAVSTDGDGVVGTSNQGAGVRGFSSAYYGVYGESPYNGVMGYAYSNGPGLTGVGSMGVYGRGIGAGGNGVGVYAWGAGGENSYGIIATATDAKKDNWAGWFDGNVAITGTCSPCVISDARTKRNIRGLKGGLKKVLAMQAHSYEMRNDEFSSTMNLAQGPQNGLIAQELEAVVPEAVHPVKVPPHYTEEERKQGIVKEPVELKSVNYTALIPLLIAAIQEQQAEIDALKAKR